jgi:hypothetical protein
MKVVCMPESRKWVIDSLRHLGYTEAADEAARVLPDPVPLDQVLKFADRHRISRDELIDRMGGSP